MRDPRRIPRICEKLCIIWEAMPDQRYGQLLENLTRFYKLFPVAYKGDGTELPTMWNQEDSKTEEMLDKIIDEINKNKK